jgi:glycosyltransferase involved in cell wall biosynthesis
MSHKGRNCAVAHTRYTLSMKGPIKVAFLFGGVRGPLLRSVLRGEDPGGGLWGLLGLRRLGVSADILEIEEWIPARVARFLRYRVLGTYAAHLPLLPIFFRYDVIYTAGAFTSQLVVTFLKTMFRFKRPLWVMQDFSIMGLLGDESRPRQKIFAWMVSRADGIVTTGLAETEALKRRFPDRSHRIAYIPFGTDTSFFSPQKHITEEPIVLAVGVDPDRDWSTFFTACEGLDVRVVIAGSGRRSRFFNPPSWVEIGAHSAHQMRELYARASVVVIPLNTSGGNNNAMGLSTLFEAMAMGKAIVVSRTDHTESFIEHGVHGILVPQKERAPMRAALEELLSSPKERARLGEAARNKARISCDMYTNAKELEDFFQQILGRALE